MKKINRSLFVLIIAAVCLSALTGCNWNLSDTKYLERPDVNLEEKGFQIRGSYVNSNTKYINIYRQDVHDSKNTKIERVAVLFPKGNDDPNDQTYIYKDKNVYSNHKYRYYVRFVTEDGEKNRTEWSEPKAPKAGVDPSASFAYNLNSGYYKYDKDSMTLTIQGATDFTPPLSTVIDDIDKYKPALVFQAGDLIQAFELSDPNTTKQVNLKTLLPQSFLNTDISLLGIVGQKKVENTSGKTTELQSITWTDIAKIAIKDGQNNTLSVIKIEMKYGDEGFDYSINSDNEN